jgi:hypothetical protein
MNGKQVKKLNRIALKDRKAHLMEAQSYIEQTLGNILKPKPKWCPKRLYLWGARIFLKF